MHKKQHEGSRPKAHNLFLCWRKGINATCCGGAPNFGSSRLHERQKAQLLPYAKPSLVKDIQGSMTADLIWPSDLIVLMRQLEGIHRNVYKCMC